MATNSFSAATTCRSRRHQGEARPSPLRGLYICADCRERLENHLVELPGWYDGCAADLDYHRHQVNSRQPSGIVLKNTVVTIRSDILSALASWCGLVVEERGVRGPNQLDIRQMATFLAIHLTWLTAHPSAPDLVDEFADLAETACGVVVPRNHFRVEMGVCDRSGCGRMVYAESYSENDEVPYRVACEAGHVWPPNQRVQPDRPE